MPYIDIKVAGQLSSEQKSDIAAEVADTMERIANKPKSATYITFTEIPRNSWAKNGELLIPHKTWDSAYRINKNLDNMITVLLNAKYNGSQYYLL